MRKLLRLTGIFIAVVLCTHALASAMVTQHVLGRLAGMGMTIPFSLRVSSTIHDIMGMAPSYLPLIAIGFLIAFLVAAVLARLAPAARTALFVLAGAVALITVNLAMAAVLEIVPIASARTTAGLLVQGVAGAVGGFLFALFAARSRMPADTRGSKKPLS